MRTRENGTSSFQGSRTRILKARGAGRAFSWTTDRGIETLPAGKIGGGPTWNVAYRKSLLVEADARLEKGMEHGDDLAEWFGGRGIRVYFEPRAKLDHANVSMAKWWIEQRYLCGLLVANARRKRWSGKKRLLYVAASPLIPAVILYRLRHPLKDPDFQRIAACRGGCRSRVRNDRADGR